MGTTGQLRPLGSSDCAWISRSLAWENVLDIGPSLKRDVCYGKSLT